jgi:hypothetical protein
MTRRVTVAPCLDCRRDLDHCHDAWLVLEEVCADPGCRLPVEAHALVVRLDDADREEPRPR